ncbi:hypothetical protein BV20DRAFT_973382 [Pilatotrama ljubarskyi]|nr:hypothetical protein BV20DRAFT_973382 [Pilatotrama ljubarskyi]
MEADPSQPSHCNTAAAASPPSNENGAASRLSLNLDVFRLILEYLPREGLVKLTRTYASHFVHEEVSRELLTRPVKLLRRKQLQSFCQFSLSGDPAKLSYLRSLTIQYINETLDEGQKQSLISVFRHSVNLADLQLQWCDVLLTDDSRIREAISALPALSTFNISMYQAEDTTAQAILRQTINALKHPLRRLSLPGPLCGDSLATFLQEVASVHGGVEDLFVGFYRFVAGAGMSLPRVRTLRLLIKETVPRLADLHAPFPNLQDLEVVSHVHISLPSLSLQDVHSERPGANLRSRTATWPSLNSLTATPSVIYALGLDCPVRTLDISHYEHQYHNIIAELVFRLRPRKLALDLFCSPKWDGPRADPCLLLYESRKAGNSLRPLLSASRVELLHLAMAEYFYSNDPDDIVACPPFKSHSTDGSAAHHLKVDADAIARAMAEICTSLRCIAITIVYLGHVVWRVDRTDGRVHVVKLGSYQGRRLLEKEAMRCLED